MRHEASVWVVAGEDLRWRIEGAESVEWLPGLISGLDGSTPVRSLLEALPEEHRAPASEALSQLITERLVVPVSCSPESMGRFDIDVVGEGALAEATRSRSEVRAGSPLRVLCQDTLDYSHAERFGAQARAEAVPHMWSTIGPRVRAFVSPVFLPDQGACVGCIISGFRRLSPVPEFYDVLRSHGARGGDFAPARVASAWIDSVASLIAWKVSLLEPPSAPPAVFQMHRLEAGTAEVSAHRLVIDEDCTGHQR